VIAELIERWQAARMRTFLARQGVEGVEDPADYWAELRTATEISREVLAGRWCAVASLLRAGALEYWAQAGEALGMSELEARDGFMGWVSRQADLYRHTGTGLTAAEAGELRERAEVVIL
jgi:hypothetical protein